MDVYIKQLIIHQFTPSDTELLFSNSPVPLTPRLDDYFRKKLAKVFSEEAKRGQFETENAFMNLLSDDLMASSIEIANQWREAFILSDDQKVNDLVFLAFEKEGIPHFAFLRLALKESLVHAMDANNPIQMRQDNLPSAAQTPDEALVVNKETGQYYLIEKRIKHDGSFSHYFSEEVLHVQPEQSVKKTLQVMEKTAQKVADQFYQDDFNFQTKVKSSLYQQLEEEQTLSPEKLADQLFDQNLTARLTLLDELKEVMTEPVPVSDIDTTRQLKRFENQKLSLSNGIEMIVPHHVYDNAEMVEFIQNEDGTYSILIKNIQDIHSK